jgi:hypothetical protein
MLVKPALRLMMDLKSSGARERPDNPDLYDPYPAYHAKLKTKAKRQSRSSTLNFRPPNVAIIKALPEKYTVKSTP